MLDVAPLGSDSGEDVSATPADSVLWTIKQKMLTPDLIVSGTNKGQNIGIFSGLSGTVGAARTARINGVPAIATSTGGNNLVTGPFDYAAGAEETIKLFRQWRLGQAEHADTWSTVHSINIPSCVLHNSVPLRGTLQTVLTTVDGCIPSDPDAFNIDCLIPAQGGASVDQVDGATDVQAFHNGYVSIANVGTAYPGTCP